MHGRFGNLFSPKRSHQMVQGCNLLQKKVSYDRVLTRDSWRVTSMTVVGDIVLPVAADVGWASLARRINRSYKDVSTIIYKQQYASWI